jgi:toxin-antitoxin system PIN domain toxin
MRCVDVNVLVYAHRADLPEHQAYRGLLEDFANAEEPLGLPDAVCSGFLRVMTNRRIFSVPSPAGEVWQAIDNLLTAPAVMRLKAGERHWSIFRRLATEACATGNDIADAYLAAYAVENNATWLSADRGFSRFTSLRYRHPLD